jgi:hypothetical protein
MAYGSIPVSMIRPWCVILNDKFLKDKSPRKTMKNGLMSIATAALVYLDLDRVGKSYR